MVAMINGKDIKRTPHDKTLYHCASKTSIWLIKAKPIGGMCMFHTL